MEKKEVTKLINIIREQVPISIEDYKPFREVLSNLEVKDSRRFAETIPENDIPINGVDAQYNVSLRRIIRNKNAKQREVSFLKKAFNGFTNFIGAYSSSGLVRSLRSDSGVIYLLSKSPDSFSLLGKIKTYYFDGYSNPTMEIRPFLIVPGCVDNDSIRDWENRNTFDGIEQFFSMNYKRRESN